MGKWCHSNGTLCGVIAMVQVMLIMSHDDQPFSE